LLRLALGTNQSINRWFYCSFLMYFVLAREYTVEWPYNKCKTKITLWKQISLAFTFRQTTTKVVQGAFVFVPAITAASTVLLYDIHISIVPKRRLSTENLINLKKLCGSKVVFKIKHLIEAYIKRYLNGCLCNLSIKL
jgi:hypothetical protein